MIGPFGPGATGSLWCMLKTPGAPPPPVGRASGLQPCVQADAEGQNRPENPAGRPARIRRGSALVLRLYTATSDEAERRPRSD